MIKVIPDSSFYICFIDDIKEPKYLIRVMSANVMEFIIGQKIKEEIKRSQNYNAIEIPIDNHTQSFEYYKYGEILKPFFSAEEIKKGEDEVIAISYVMYHLGIAFIAIIDEDDSRNFVEKNFPELWEKLVGTVGFIELCYCKYKIFSKNECILLLNKIKRSKFRIKNLIIEETVERIRRC